MGHNGCKCKGNGSCGNGHHLVVGKAYKVCSKCHMIHPDKWAEGKTCMNKSCNGTVTATEWDVLWEHWRRQMFVKPWLEKVRQTLP